jgi:hypothetical protein
MVQLMPNPEPQLTDFGAVSATYSGVQLGSPTEQHEITTLDQIRMKNELATLTRIYDRIASSTLLIKAHEVGSDTRMETI